MKTYCLRFTVLFMALRVVSGPGTNIHAANGSVMLLLTNNSLQLKVDGDKDHDWWIQSSTNLPTWTTLTNLGTLLSGNETNAARRTVGTPGSNESYYRA